jgi:hypothetical protein
MRVWPLIVLSLLAGVPAGAQDVAASFAVVLPDGVADVRGWEVVSGEFETPRVRGSYLFYVNPRRQGLYQLMRYRVELLLPSPGLEEHRGSRERVAFVASPGVLEPMRCWEREAAGVVPQWQELVAGTDEYQLEMALLLQVLAVHRTALLSPAP